MILIDVVPEGMQNGLLEIICIELVMYYHMNTVSPVRHEIALFTLILRLRFHFKKSIQSYKTSCIYFPTLRALRPLDTCTLL